MSLKKRTLILMLARGISQANTLLLGIIIVRMMTQADVGTYNQAFLVYSFVSSLLYLNIDASLFYFVPALRKTRLGGFLLQSCYLTWFMGLLTAALMYFGADQIAHFFNNPRLAPFIQTLSLLPFGEKLLVLVPSFMISINRTARAGIYIFAGALTKLAIVVVVLGFKGDLNQIFQGIVITVCLVGGIGVLDMLRFARGTQWTISSGDLREQLNYCMPLLITSVVAVFNLQFGKVLISRYFDPETYAIYSFGAMEIPLIALFTSSLTKAIMPDLVELNLQGKSAEMLRLWQRAMRKCSVVMFPCFAFLMVTAGDLMTLLYGPAYRRAALPFQVLLCALPLRAAVYSALLRSLAHTSPIARSAVLGMIVNIALSLFLIEIGKGSTLGFIAPSLGSLASQWVIVFVSLAAIKDRINQPIAALIEWRDLSKLLLAFCVPAAILPFIPSAGLPLAISLIGKGVLYLALTLLLLVKYSCLDQDELAMLKSPLTYWRKLRAKSG